MKIYVVFEPKESYFKESFSSLDELVKSYGFESHEQMRESGLKAYELDLELDTISLV